MRNGQSVKAFEEAFAEYVGAKYAIALCNGTATLHTALYAMGVDELSTVPTTPLTMSATTIAILQAGAKPLFCDVDPDTWLMKIPHEYSTVLPVSLYGLHQPDGGMCVVDDAAQTLRPHSGCSFTSYSFQHSKILPLGEGGMLVTDYDFLAEKARSFSSLGYKLDPKSPRIDPAILKSPDYERHHLPVSWNYRMNDITAHEGWNRVSRTRFSLPKVEMAKMERLAAASYYREAARGCDWITPQYVPEGWTHDYWCYAVAVDTKERASHLSDAIVRFGGERPYGAWRLTYWEPAFTHLAWRGIRCEDGDELVECPVAEDLQPRLLQFQTNDLRSAEQNADALHRAIRELSG